MKKDASGFLKLSLVFATIFSSPLFALTAFADAAPSASLTISPQSINNNYAISLSWTVANGNGLSVNFNCPAGVTLKSENGSAFPCNTRQSLGTGNSGSAGFTVTNVSGTTKNISVTAYPKNAAGTDYDAGSANASFSVATSPQPIVSFSVSTTTVSSNSPVTFSWTGVDTSGTNLQFDCADSLQMFSTDPVTPGLLACGTSAFALPQPQSGSLTIKPVNNSASPISITVRVLPSIVSGWYDSTHSLSTTITVAGQKQSPSPSVSDFSSSAQIIQSGAPFVLSWATLNAAAANIQFQCNDALTFESVKGTSGDRMNCNTPAFVAPLAASGNTTVKVTNAGPYRQNVSMSLFPQNASGVYIGPAARTLSLVVSAPGEILATSSSQTATTSQTPTPTAPPTPAPAPAPAQATSIPVQASPKRFVFTLPLRRGMQNAEVKALQAFLAQSPGIYPEGITSGYFGPATQLAIQRFQEKYKIAKKGVVGYGSVGPGTRAKLNSLPTP